ncbi:hypothetical protein SAMD00019534_072750 [Acytostelium subglobosum LB1]|uniref:hypothetical protein n=1 Tax=Acytostelium subglobosum LB1 TaxID=1410327 RepID=UPI0006451053|nr:hypothetical protein SAMD00019534_072750 [Acytostelium subglobosum LB1]GAM24100.1 hypothetical protein SAMD00019534_072750 [Acytostelium subglobosum LB1]|eukprot:XP_012753136.1 hypothetical protein SAMD00019534_072750 [Acytostelium subglobosum LB1]
MILPKSLLLLLLLSLLLQQQHSLVTAHFDTSDADQCLICMTALNSININNDNNNNNNKLDRSELLAHMMDIGCPTSSFGDDLSDHTTCRKFIDIYGPLLLSVNVLNANHISTLDTCKLVGACKTGLYQGDFNCPICQYVVDQMQPLVIAKQPSQVIIQTVENDCTTLGDRTFIQTCQSITVQYGQQLIVDIEQSMKAPECCIQVGMCNNSTSSGSTGATGSSTSSGGVSSATSGITSGTGFTSAGTSDGDVTSSSSTTIQAQ